MMEDIVLLETRLTNPKKEVFGPITGKYVLYRVEDVELENGIPYQNVEKHLRNLCTIRPPPGGSFLLQGYCVYADVGIREKGPPAESQRARGLSRIMPGHGTGR